MSSILLHSTIVQQMWILPGSHVQGEGTVRTYVATNNNLAWDFLGISSPQRKSRDAQALLPPCP